MTRSSTGATARVPATPAAAAAAVADASARKSGSRGRRPSSSSATAAAAWGDWLAADPSKRWAEAFFLAYSPFWIVWALCVLVPFGLYEHLDSWGYMLVGLAAALPCVVVPLLLPPCEADRGRPLSERFWVKANVWVLIFGYVGNYFWTHYFFNLLGAAYTFPSFKLNGVSHECDEMRGEEMSYIEGGQRETTMIIIIIATI